MCVTELCVKEVCVKDVCSRLCVKQVCGRKRSVLKSVCSRRCRQVPRLSRKTKVDVTKRHARHAKQRLMSPSATPATQNQGRCRQAPGLPRKTKVNVGKRRACHAKRHGATGDQRDPAQCCKRHPGHAKPRPMSPRTACHVKPRLSPSATPATQNACQAPPLPRKTKVDVAKCHACHAKRKLM